MKTRMGLLILFFYLVAPGIQAQVTEKNYKIFSVKENREVSVQDIVNDMQNAQVLFFGEEHNDSVGHYLEARIFEAMFARYSQGVTLSMEMFERDVQTVMNEYLDFDIREGKFQKDARVWSNYKDYKPMVEFAKKNNLDVVCANAPSRYTNLVGRKGMKALADLPASSKVNFAPVPYDTATGAYYEKLLEFSGHAPASKNDTSKKAAPPPVMSMGGFNLILSQSLWDASMAYSIAEYLKKHKGQKVFQVNGRFHSDEGFAIVTQLKKYSPKSRALIISCGPDESFPNVNWEDFKHLGDYIIITDPAVPRTYE